MTDECLDKLRDIAGHDRPTALDAEDRAAISELLEEVGRLKEELRRAGVPAWMAEAPTVLQMQSRRITRLETDNAALLEQLTRAREADE